MCPSRDHHWWICLLILLRQVPPPHRVRLHLKVRGDPIALGKPNSRMTINPTSFDAASTSQVRLTDAYFGGVDGRASGRPIASGRRKFRRLRQPCGWNLVLQRRICCPKQKSLGETPLHTEPVLQLSRKLNKTEATWDHYLRISPDTSHYMEAIFSMFRKIYGKQPGDPVEDLNVNLAIWWMFMNTTLHAAVHFGKDYDTKLHYAKNHIWDSLGQLFDEIKRLMITTSKVHVFSDSVLCMERNEK